MARPSSVSSSPMADTGGGRAASGTGGRTASDRDACSRADHRERAVAAVERVGEVHQDAAVAAVVHGQRLAAADGAEHGALRGGGEPAGMGERLEQRAPGVLGEEAEDAGRVEGAVAAEEGRGGGDAEPAPADGGGADEVGGEGEAQDDLAEEVVVVEHHRDGGGGHGRVRSLTFHLLGCVSGFGESGGTECIEGESMESM